MGRGGVGALAGACGHRLTWVRQRPADGSGDEGKTRRAGLLVDLTESAFYTAVRHGVEGPFLDLHLGLDQAVRQVAGSYLPVTSSASETWAPRKAMHPGVSAAGCGVGVG